MWTLLGLAAAAWLAAACLLAAMQERVHLGHGLVPAGVARTLGVAEAALIELAEEGLTRPVRFVARKSMFAQDLIRSFYKEVSTLAASV